MSPAESITRSDPVTAAEADFLFAGLANARNLLLAVSGGPDSLALLYLAAQWRRTGAATGEPRPGLQVAVVDHGLRPEAAGEARVVMDQAHAAGLPAATLVWTGEKPVTGVQAAARLARYDLLFAHAHAQGASHVLTAHHADDLAETILMRLCAGSGLAGLAGIAPLSDRDGIVLARPLLAVPKLRLISTCEAAGLPWATDPGNLDARKGRGRLRHLAAELEVLGLGRERLLRLGRRAARADAALEQAADQALARLDVRRADAASSFDMRRLAAEPEEIVVRSLARLVMQVAPAGPVRLERLERAAGKLMVAALAGCALTTTLAGVALRLDRHGVCQITPELRRRGARLDG